MKLFLAIACTFLLTFFTPQQLHAQALSIDQFEYHLDTAHAFLGNIGAYAKARKQKDNVFEAELNSHVGYLSTLHTYLLVADMDFNTVDGRKVVNQGFGHFRVSLFRKKMFMTEFFAQSQFDAGRNLESRYVLGGGVKTHLINKKNTRCTLAFSAFAEDEDWLAYTDTQEQYTIANNNLKLSFNFTIKHQFNENLRFYLSGYYQFRPEAPQNPRVTGNTFLALKATKKISVRLSYEQQFDEQPIVEESRFTYLFKTGIFYSL